MKGNEQNLKVGDFVVVNAKEGNNVSGIVLKMYPHRVCNEGHCEMFILVTHWGGVDPEVWKHRKRTWNKYGIVDQGFYVHNGDKVILRDPCEVRSFLVEGAFHDERCFTYSESSELVSTNKKDKWINGSSTIIRTNEKPYLSYAIVERKIVDNKGCIRRQSTGIAVETRYSRIDLESLTKSAYKDAEKKLIDLLD